MAKRRRSRRGAARGMIGGLRKNIKKFAGAGIGLTGLFIAAAPAIQAVNAATNQGQTLTQGSLSGIPNYLAAAYGVTPQTGTVDFGKLITAVVFPVAGGYIFIKGLRMIMRSV